MQVKIVKTKLILASNKCARFLSMLKCDIRTKPL